jgi:paraquat-inducible protein B
MTEKTKQTNDKSIGVAPIMKQRHSMSIIWIVPLVAVLIGGWLAYTSIIEKGPLITVTFQTADGLEAGKTKVKFKSVEVGIVETIDIATDLDHVRLKIRMKKGANPYLTENTTFWVVRARVTASAVTGLGTLLGGAYIGVEPSREGESAESFVGLEKTPIITSEMRGKRFSLNAPRLGSLNPGSPIYFRQIKVGTVVDFELDKDGNDVGINIFIDAPYDQFVRENTRFWISSGLDLQLTANGLRVDTQSMVSLMIGGIAFNTATDVPSPEAETNAQFTLYENWTDAEKERSESQNDYYIEFTDSVRGLSVGAPVEFRGFQLGSVTDIQLISDYQNLKFSTMVRISINQHQISIPSTESPSERLDHFIKGGLRAQLKIGNLLSGQLFIDLTYFNDIPAIEPKQHKGLAVLPSVPAASQTIMNDLGKFIKKINDLPLDKIFANLKTAMVGIDNLVNSPDLRKAIGALNRILTELDTTIALINTGTIPQVNSTLSEVETLVKDMDNWVSADSLLYDDLRNSLNALSDAARSITDLTDMLSRHPEALIQGKKSEGQL